jgi:hypothetical protein
VLRKICAQAESCFEYVIEIGGENLWEKEVNKLLPHLFSIVSTREQARMTELTEEQDLQTLHQ